MQITKPSKKPSFHESLHLPKTHDIVLKTTVDDKKSIEELQKEGKIDSEGNPIIKYHYTANVPPLTYGDGKTKRVIEVNIGSSQATDEALLHKLLGKVNE